MTVASLARVGASSQQYRRNFQLSDEDQQQFLQESSQLAKVLSTSFKADKLNVAVLGNVVRQLHVHHVVRYVDDCRYPSPVWGVGEAVPYTDAELKNDSRCYSAFSFFPDCLPTGEPNPEFSAKQKRESVVITNDQQ